MMSYEDYQLEHEYEEYMEKQYEEYMMYMEEQYYIQTEMPDDYVKQEIEDRELAEQNGVLMMTLTLQLVKRCHCTRQHQLCLNLRRKRIPPFPTF